MKCIIAAVTLDTIIALNINAEFVIPLVAFLTSSPTTLHEYYLWNFYVLQTVHLSKLVIKHTVRIKHIEKLHQQLCKNLLVNLM